MTIDIHAHTVPAPFIEAARTEVPEVAPKLVKHDDGWWMEYPDGRLSGPVPEGMFEVEARLADMDALGVQVHALSVPPPHFNYRIAAEAAAVAARLHNDAMVDMARAYPERFVVLGHLPMQSVDHALAELERLSAIPEVRGLELGTNIGGVNLGEPQHEPIWEAIDATGFAVVLHPGADVAGVDRMHKHYIHNFVGNPTDTTVAAASLIFQGVLTRNQRLRFALLHGGGFVPYQIGRWDHGWGVRAESREHVEVLPSELLDRFWVDSLTHDPLSLQFLLQRIGESRLVLGSDYPFDMASVDPVGALREALADQPAAVERAVGANAHELLTRLVA